MSERPEVPLRACTQFCSFVSISSCSEHTTADLLSDKQWKDHLSKSGYKRNLDRQAAAIILHLLNEADHQHLKRLVWYNNDLKDRKEINRYISKSETISTPEELLQSLPESLSSWPRSIKWSDRPDVPAEQSHAARNGTLPLFENRVSPGDAVDALDTATWSQPHLPSSPSFSVQIGGPPLLTLDSFPYSPIHAHENPDVSMVHKQNRSLMPGSAAFRMPDANPSVTFPSQMIEASYLDRAAGQSASELADIFTHQHDEFSGLYDSIGSRPDITSPAESSLSGLHGLVSVTPFNIDDPASLQKRVDLMLGKPTAQHDSNAKKFTRSCLEACIYDGQDAHDNAVNAISEAVDAFQTLMNATYECSVWSLTILNRVSFLLESYGQRNMKSAIFRDLLNISNHPHEPRWRILHQTLFFLIDRADWGPDKAASHIPRVKHVWKTAIEIAGTLSALALSAQYNVAWVLLESQRYRDALNVLNHGRAGCESVFGRNSLESITWIGTQARAHSRCDESETAVALMEENVSVRAAATYGKNHPLYWEVQSRIGLFLLERATQTQQPHSTNETRSKGENLLRETLIWRAKELGMANPQTTAVLKWLKDELLLQGRKQQAEGLFEWCAAKIGMA